MTKKQIAERIARLEGEAEMLRKLAALEDEVAVLRRKVASPAPAPAPMPLGPFIHPGFPMLPGILPYTPQPLPWDTGPYYISDPPYGTMPIVTCSASDTTH